jgi:hypothetical protein
VIQSLFFLFRIARGLLLVTQLVLGADLVNRERRACHHCSGDGDSVGLGFVHVEVGSLAMRYFDARSCNTS